jgi:hypothetical protein
MIDFPASPTTGQQFTAAGVTWTWDGIKWQASGLGTNYLPLSGGTMAGPLTLAGDPTLALHPVTKQMFDRQSGFTHDNRIINGDMRWDQHNSAAVSTPAPGIYAIDRWKFGSTQSSKLSFQRGTGGSGLLQFGFGYYLNATVQAAFAPTAVDYFQIYQPIEVDMISDFAFGTPNAQPVTLSFWAHSSTNTGTFGGSIGNTDGTRSYPFTFTIPVLNTWMKFVIAIPGDTAGTWVLNTTGVGAILHFDYGSGANYRGAAGAWASANLVGANGAINLVATNGAILNITGVKLEIGNVATPFARQSITKSFADCQRYYQTGMSFLQGYAATNTVVQAGITLPVAMRALPTVTPTWNTQSNCGSSGITAASGGTVAASTTVTATGQYVFIGTFTASAEL